MAAVAFTKECLLSQFQATRLHWKKHPLHYPVFIVELEYLDFFYLLIKNLTSNDSTNIVPEITAYLEQPFKNSFEQICRLLDNHTANGLPIWKLISEQRLILRQDQRKYNKQVAGKSPKGLTSNCWMVYNHWVLATALWKGFVDAQEPGFTILLTELFSEYSDDPVEVLLASEYRPLWGLWVAFNALGRPLISWGNENNAIYVHPFGALIEYTGVVADWDYRCWV